MTHIKYFLSDIQMSGIQMVIVWDLVRKQRVLTPYFTFISVLYLDRLAVVFLNVRPELSQGAVHPCQQVASSLWPVMCATFDNFPGDERVMERCCRTLRFVVRCLGTQSVSLMQPMIERIVNIYQIYSHSCFLYRASVLVRKNKHFSIPLFTRI